MAPFQNTKLSCSFLETAAQARLRAACETRGRGKPCRVNTIGNDADILPVEIIGEQRGGALGDGGEGNVRVRVDAALQSCQKRVVSAAMETPKKPRPGGFEFFFAGNFQKTMEQHVNDDDIGVETVNPRRKDEVE